MKGEIPVVGERGGKVTLTEHLLQAKHILFENAFTCYSD